MSQSWEFYQQPAQGVALPLHWVAGLAATAYPQDNLRAFAPLNLVNERLFAIPFDQLRAARVTHMFVNVTTRAANGAVRVGIYETVSPSNNAPGRRLLRSNSILVDQVGVKTIPLQLGAAVGTNLAANRRYWAVLQTNANVNGGVIDGLGIATAPVLFWGVTKENPNAPQPHVVPIAGARANQAWGDDLPQPFPPNNIAAHAGLVPCLGLTFESVAAPAPVQMEQGNIDGNVPPNSFTPTG